MFYDILVPGEILWDCCEQERNLAGAPFNFAKHIHRLGAAPFFVSAVGNDDDGDQIMLRLAGMQIPNELSVSGCKTGICKVTRSPSGENQYDLLKPAAWDDITISSAVLQAADAANAIYFGTLAQRDMASRAAIQQLVTGCFVDKQKVLDVNLRPPYDDEAVIRWSVEHCDILKYSAEEKLRLSYALFGQRIDDAQVIAVRCMDTYGVSIVVETLGKRGAQAWSSSGENAYADAPEVKAVSTVGAGDAFIAAFYVATLRGMPLNGALQYAVNYASRVVAGYIH